MLTLNDRANLVNLAMQAEAESYNAYFMRGATDILKEYADNHGSNILWDFLKNASDCTYRLYLELCWCNSPLLKPNTSYKV